MRFVLLILKNASRNKLRLAITGLAVMALVAIWSLIATVVHFLDSLLVERSRNILVVITERHRLLSAFDKRFYEDIVSSTSAFNQELRKMRGFQPDNHTVWHFAGFSIDPDLKDPNKFFFAVGTFPDKVQTMTEGMEKDWDPALVDLVRHPPKSRLDNAGLVVGALAMRKLNKQVGDFFKAKCTTHRDQLGNPIEIEFEVVGTIPESNRWAEVCFMDVAYLDRILKKYKHEMDGRVTHALLQVDDKPAAEEISARIEGRMPELRCETMASAYSRALEPMQGMLNGVKFVLVPAILAVMTLIVANAVSMTVRERMTEMAVLKILGFSPGRIVMLILGEALLIGLMAALLSSLLTWGIVNLYMGGVYLPLFPRMYIPFDILALGPLLGVGTALLGSLIPAWTARSVRPAEVFAKVT